MFKITSTKIIESCDYCGIDLQDDLTINDINKSNTRYHLCQDCKNKIANYGGESSEV